MKRFATLLLALLFMAGAGKAFVQVDVPATHFPTGHGISSASMVLFGNPTTFAATLIQGPDGFPSMYHLVFDYDDSVQGGVVTSITINAGICSKTWTPTAFTVFYQMGPAFPVNWAMNGTVSPDDQPFVLCTCWPNDPACLPPTCSVSVASLDFGHTQPSTPVTRTFTITNTGGGTLSGTVTEDCAEFSITSGATYSLSNGQSQTVTLQMNSATPGTYSCTLDTGGDCADVSLTGVVDPPPACSLDTGSLDFGTTPSGTAVTRTFTITNTGGGTLSGVLSEACSNYSITAPLTYSLTAGASRTVTVTFNGAVPGTYTCAINAGSSCGTVNATGIIEALPACSVSPTTLDFGSVQPGVAVERTFTITNTGGGTLSGTVAESCAPYSFTSATSYALTAGQSQTFTVVFQGETPGSYPCILDSGGACTDVSCTGTIQQPPACGLSVSALDFGHVYVGESSQRTFTVTNTGQGTLSGSYSSCGAFEVMEGGEFSLGAGQSQPITVAFFPLNPGNYGCDLDGLACADIPLTGTSDFAPVCSLSTASLDFGSMQPGVAVERVFTITNSGGSLLSGTVSSLCDELSIISMDGPTYDLQGGESRNFTVRFQSVGGTPAGAFGCALDLESDLCEDIACSATVEVATACSVDVEALNFGIMQAGVAVDRDFTITNAGGGTLTGTVSSPCEDFVVISEAAYALGNGQTQTFTVRYTGDTPGLYTCTLDLGGALCSDLPMTAEVDEAPACAMSVDTLDFGLVYVGIPVSRSFTLSNTGGGTLSGSLSLECADFTTEGSLAYSLTEGQSQVFTFTASPTEAGLLSCLVQAGDCSVVFTGTASAAPVCQLSADSLDFGNVYPNVASNRSFTITNVGGGVLEGTVSESCGEFTVLSGGTFALATGETQTVTLSMSSATQGTYTCSVQASTYCNPIVCTGIVEAPATCSVEPGYLDFGTLMVGESDTLSFTITNVGGYVLEGTLTESCNEFEILTELDYHLLAGESHDVLVRFNATASGSYACPIIGIPSCVNAVVPCIANVLSPDDCAISVESIAFGLTQLGTPVTRSFRITNTGQARLTGSVAFSGDAQFQIISGGTYDLAPAHYQDVTVRLLATQLGDYSCTLDPDLPCGTVTCTGSVEPAPACLIEPSSIDFGLQYPSTPTVRNFTITNTGYGTLSGAVASVCGNFVLTSPANYSLTHGQSQTFTVDFLSATPGDFSCQLDLGGLICADLPLSGRVEAYPACAVVATNTDFGTVLPGTLVTRSFTITNSGGHTLSGTVTEECAAISIQSGASYTLGMGQSHTVTVAFQSETPGSYSCTLDTGGDCQDVAFTGAVDNAPACAVSAGSLDFGLLLPNEAATRSFTITNTGGFTLEGEVSLDCPGYSILSGASYSLAHNESQTVVVQLQSGGTGDFPCTLSTGGTCADVALSGRVEMAPQCVVGASLIDFGLLLPDEVSTRTFTISNAGGHTLTGEVTTVGECPGVEVVDGAYTLGMGQSHTVTLTFSQGLPGEYSCSLNTGCEDAVTLVAEVQPAADCQLSTGSLDFGTVLPGTSVVRDFTITNNGGHTLSGTVSESCGAYTVANGTYSLTAGQSHTVTVTFTSQVAGTYPCTLLVGSCGDIAMTGTVELAPACVVSVANLDFGTVQPGTPVTRTFTVTNVGGGTLSGAVSEDCEAYTVTNGVYNLTAGQSQTVTVTFQSAVSGAYACTLDSGGSCADIALTGAVELAPACAVSVANLDFGTVLPGTSVVRTFTVTNAGGGTLSGAVTESCGTYTVANGTYSLTAGQSQTVTVTFQSATAGSFPCTLDTGGSCADIALTGAVELAPACAVSVANLDFGTVLPGSPVVRTFTVTNVGGGTLSGAVTASCGTFTVANGTYSLTAGQSQTVSVTFQNAVSGAYACTLDTGGSCADIALTASVAGVTMVVGAESACGAVDNLGHFNDSTIGFVPDWESGAIGLNLANMGGATLTVSVVVGANAVWSGQVTGSTWLANTSTVDLSDYFSQNILLHLEVSDGTSVWNDNGAVCNWDLSFLQATELSMPQAFLLHEAAPNPFNPVTHLRLDLPQAGPVRMTVSDLRGRQVAVLVDGEMPAGSHDLVWEPGHVASGTYFVTAESRQGVQVRKVLFLK